MKFLDNFINIIQRFPCNFGNEFARTFFFMHAKHCRDYIILYTFRPAGIMTFRPAGIMTFRPAGIISFFLHINNCLTHVYFLLLKSYVQIRVSTCLNCQRFFKHKSQYLMR